MKQCAPIQTQLSAYLLGTLSPAQKAAVETHLETCADCRAELETLTLLSESFDAAPVPEPRPSWRFMRVQVRPTRRMTLKEYWFSHQFKAALTTGCTACLFLLISISFVAVQVIQKQDMSFSAKEVARPTMKLKKLKEPTTVKKKKAPPPKLRKRIVTQHATAEDKMPDMKLPEMAGVKGGIANVKFTDELTLFGGTADRDEGFLSEMSSTIHTAPKAQKSDQVPEELMLQEAEERDLFGTDDLFADAPAHPAQAAFNPYIETIENAFSTFSIDVDTASYGIARNQLEQRLRPAPERVRTEEFVNNFDYDYRPPTGSQTFSTHREMAPSPFRRGLDLLKIGIKGRRIGRDDHRGAVLTLVIDTSGSMSTPERIGLVKQSLRLLIDQLAPEDEVAIIQFGGTVGLVAEHTPISEKEKLLSAIEALQPGGATQFDQGLKLGYDLASSGFKAGASNRIIILSDGVANLGELDPKVMLETVGEKRRSGIYLSVLGFGSGNYDDHLLEQLANRGDGTYAYIDTLDEARRLLVDQLAATLHVIASDVKIQVEFNPDRVARYRQLGYENRQLTKEQFRDDSVDAGEVGSGQTVTALYDLELLPEGDPADPIATVYVRYRRADNGTIEEISSRVMESARFPTFAEAPPRFRLAACAAEFAEKLRRSPYSDGTELIDIIEQLNTVATELPLDQQVKELLRLLNLSASFVD